MNASRQFMNFLIKEEIPLSMVLQEAVYAQGKKLSVLFPRDI